jgi:hypothetical protein
MNRVKVTVCLVVAILSVAPGQVFGITEYKDGAVHNITSTINEDDVVWVDHLAPGMQTTVNMLDGARIPAPARLEAWSDSRVNISGGVLERHLSALENSRVTISKGSVGDIAYGVNAYGSSTVTISGGSVGSNSMYCIQTAGSSTLNMTGGSVGGRNSLYGLIAQETSTVNISGGSVNSTYGIEVWNSSALNISGGLLGGTLMAANSSRMTIMGGNFAIDGHHVGPGTYFAGDFLGGQGILTGTLANGDAINNPFTLYPDARLVLVPEPATLLVVGLGGLVLRRKS